MIAAGADERRLAVAAGERADFGLAGGELDEEDRGDARPALPLIREEGRIGPLGLAHRAAPEHRGFESESLQSADRS